MVIANPIYDVVFKKLMENEKVAKFFISTLLDTVVEAVAIKPQEYTYKGEFEENDPKAIEIIEERIRKRYNIWVYRLDFVATIKTETGEYKKVLVEIQKARNQVDLMRFRNYLAEQYKKEDQIDDRKTILPITTIYILGFKLPEIESPCIKVERNYKDLINNQIIEAKSDFVEKLTHDSFIVQVERITSRYQTKLDKLLSLFEQRHFIDDNGTIKEFKHEIDSDDLKLTTEILHYSGTDPQEKKKIEIEQEAFRTINAILENERLKERLKEKKFLEVIDEKDKELNEKDKELNEKNRQIEELMRKLNEKK